MAMNRRGPKMKSMGALRGEGLLLAGEVKIVVRYQLDRFIAGDRETGSGELSGDLSLLVEEEGEETEGGVQASLRLADGAEKPITLTSIEADGATFETR